MEKLEDEYSKKELVINAWSLPYDLSNTDISEIAGCSYEYARRIVDNIEEGEIEPEEYEDEELKSALENKLQADQLGLPDFESDHEALSTKKGTSSNILGTSDDEISDGLQSVINGDGASKEKGDSDKVDREYLEKCLTEISGYYREANFHRENGEQWALWQYYVSVRAHQLLLDLLEDYDESVPKEEIADVSAIFRELYYEANFEEENNLKGAKQKKFTALRIYEMLQFAVEDKTENDIID